MEVIASFEELSSFSAGSYTHQEECLPRFVDSSPFLKALEVGHPMIRDAERVCNDVKMDSENRIFILTGSNMSGKSTFLRTLGTNLVLAFAGAPVCAREFVCSPMHVATSMRTHDNLEGHVSSFYAEALRIKSLLQLAATGQPLFFLIDEIFKGTNSHDRLLGAETVIRKLHSPHCLGLVSTHDLALADLANDPELKIRNFHFRETYQQDTLSFDYKLRPGTSDTTNGVYLFKMIGIIDPLRI
jgi:DNA mismatch repair ATPase MutS